MSKQSMQALLATTYLSGGNAAYVEALYENYLADPNSIAPEWRSFFQSLPQVADNSAQDVSHAAIREQFLQLAKQPIRVQTGAGDVQHARQQGQVYRMVNAFRSRGHHHATLDPLQLRERPRLPDLALEHYGFSSADKATKFDKGDFSHPSCGQTLGEIYQALQNTYCGNIGFEIKHISDHTQTQWLEDYIETHQARAKLSAEAKCHILKKLVAAEGLEKYLGSKFVGQKRFSLEGGEAMIPMIDEMIRRSGGQGAKEIIIGMAHRGRLNVLINIFGKSPEQLFQEFAGAKEDDGRSGDVKYHMGFSSDVETDGGPAHIALAFNPSHLEIISPVVEGSVRARQNHLGDNERSKVLPIIIHGDAAMAGQGVVMETFNFSQARGYCTGGTIHIVVNNQVGFTTSNPLDSRSTLYCTDVAKMVQAPVLHVNGDDPEAVAFVTQMAVDFRARFKRDVVIDLVCYRRHGHNEADEPSGTQPMMYKKINKHKTAPNLYAAQLIEQGVIDKAEFDAMQADYRARLDAGQSVVALLDESTRARQVDWAPYIGVEWTADYQSSVDSKTLKRLGERMTDVPEGFNFQKQVKKTYDDRDKMTAGDLELNWGYAELMAYASLLEAGHPVRISGQDCGRGTFAHRHVALHDHDKGQTHIPLQHLSDKQADFIVIDSVLSEEAVLAFEYGFATAEPNGLTIWEAQFGDFANGAQVVIDQFISSGWQKWGRLCGLVMLLPHGYEGMGPEHSSARLERFMQLCAQYNIQVCVPTTPAQVFHMLRRQVMRPFRKPLIVMSPKSLLRHPMATSKLSDLSSGKFQLVLPEIDKLEAKKVKRIVLCCGKVYYDLLHKRRNEAREDVALVRVEQLYPFPETDIRDILKTYPKAKEVVWCQEEPKNQGAWYSIRHHIQNILGKGQDVRYAGREASASPAVGYASLHLAQQEALVEDAVIAKWDTLTI